MAIKFPKFVEGDRKKKSLAILGMGGSYSWFEYQIEHGERPAEDIWAVNNVGIWLKDAQPPFVPDLVIAMDDLKRDEDEFADYVRDMTSLPYPLLTCTKHDYKNTFEYPIKAVMKYLWPRATRMDECRPVIDNTICYAFALAIYRGYSTIFLYGCDFRFPDEPIMIDDWRMEHKGKPYWYVYHMAEPMMRRRDREPGLTTLCYLIGHARERGIEVRLPQNTTLFDMDRPFYCYGYQDQPDYDLT